MPTATRIRDHCLAPGRAVDADGASYRAVDPGWRPTLPPAQAARFSLSRRARRLAGGRSPG
jgi:hypothetical protein